MESRHCLQIWNVFPYIADYADMGESSLDSYKEFQASSLPLPVVNDT